MGSFIIGVVGPREIGLFGIFLLIVILGLIAIFAFNLWLTRLSPSLSPYSKLPLQRGSELSYDTSIKVLRFLYDMHQYDNRIFNLRQAAVCRETGRIFPDAVTWYDRIKVDWSFLQKRYPGKYVSWGSLIPEQQELLRAMHESLEDFQTEFSSPNPQPRAIEAKYAFAKPGPLYVDIETNVLLGWKIVPDTDFEVLVVQKPIQVRTISVT